MHEKQLSLYVNITEKSIFVCEHSNTSFLHQILFNWDVKVLCQLFAGQSVKQDTVNSLIKTVPGASLKSQVNLVQDVFTRKEKKILYQSSPLLKLTLHKMSLITNKNHK